VLTDYRCTSHNTNWILPCVSTKLVSFLLISDTVRYYVDEKLILLVFSNKFCFAETLLQIGRSNLSKSKEP